MSKKYARWGVRGTNCSGIDVEAFPPRVLGDSPQIAIDCRGFGNSTVTINGARRLIEALKLAINFLETR